MTMYSRRDLAKLIGGAMLARAAGVRLQAQETLIDGIRAGAISYCFRSIPRPANGDYMDTIIDAFRQTGLSVCELESVRVEPGLSADGFVEVTPIEGTLAPRDLVVVGFEGARAAGA